jgi:cob(I)alamin adenosyltransferase
VVRLTRIYTRLGDEGDTHLGDMSRARKTSPRVVAYG